MEESFVMMKEHYNVKKKNVSSKINNIDENKINDQEDDFDNINIDNINDHDINDINDNDINDMSNNISDNEEIIENDVNKKQNINKQDSGSNSNLLLDMKEKLEINQKKYLLEQKKTLDKIFLFKKHAGKYNQIFLEDMQERKQKEIEEKIAENTQINKSSKKYEEPVRNNGRRKR
jgi:hypothetical protein